MDPAQLSGAEESVCEKRHFDPRVQPDGEAKYIQGSGGAFVEVCPATERDVLGPSAAVMSLPGSAAGRGAAGVAAACWNRQAGPRTQPAPTL